jgi:GT2 family glycosyltransferase
MISAQKVWVLIPVHNRKDITRKCLVHLRTIGIPSDFLICVVDDGCTDGTSEMLAAEFSEMHVIRGDGSLFWGGGIARGMKAARDADAEIHLWLNDDCLPDSESLSRLVDRVRITKGICGGVCYDPEDPMKVTYAGTPLYPLPQRDQAKGCQPVPAESLNGNLMAVHRDVIDQIGILPAEHLPHFGGDVIYTLRAHRRGIPVEIDPSATALNRRDDPLRKVFESGSVIRLWKETGRVASPLHFPTYWFMLHERFGWRAWLRWPAYLLRMLRHHRKLSRQSAT